MPTPCIRCAITFNTVSALEICIRSRNSLPLVQQKCHYFRQLHRAGRETVEDDDYLFRVLERIIGMKMTVCKEVPQWNGHLSIDCVNLRTQCNTACCTKTSVPQLSTKNSSTVILYSILVIQKAVVYILEHHLNVIIALPASTIVDNRWVTLCYLSEPNVSITNSPQLSTKLARSVDDSIDHHNCRTTMTINTITMTEGQRRLFLAHGYIHTHRLGAAAFWKILKILPMTNITAYREKLGRLQISHD